MKKAIITISKSFYAPSFKNGAEYISVDLDGHNFGGASPCDTEEEVQKAIEHFLEWAKKEGSKVMIVDERIKQKDLFSFNKLKGGKE